MGIKIAQTAAEPVPTGEYAAQITDITSEDGKFGPQLKFTFELLAPEDLIGRTLTGWASQAFNVKSKLYAWTRAAVFAGGNIPKEYEFDSDQLMGKTVKLVVVVRRKDDGSEFSKVEDVQPIRKATAKPASPAPTAPPTPAPVAAEVQPATPGAADGQLPW